MGDIKKVLYVITKGNFGGAQKYVYDLATSLPKDKFEAVVACGTKEGNVLVEKLLEQNIRTINLENSEREINLINDFKTVKELIKIIKQERPNAVHLNSSKIGLLGSFAILYFRILNLFRASNFKFQINAIFTAHGWAFNEQDRSFWSKLIFYIAHYFTTLICDQTIAVSAKTKRDISWLPFIENKIKVIHNGIEKFDLSADEVSNNENLKLLNEENKIILLSLSELHPNKGLDVALRALSLLPENKKENIIYFIAGNGEEKENLEKLVFELGIKNIVRFLGFVQNGKKLLPRATIFLFPSRTENLPFAILEAGMVGLPIIATSVGGIPEIIKDMQNGILVHPNNSKEMAEAILYILDHPEKQKEFGEEIKKTIINFFSFKKMLEATIKLYQ